MPYRLIFQRRIKSHCDPDQPTFPPVSEPLFPPLGLVTLAAYLDVDDLASLQDEPDLVVIQVYITNASRAYRYADPYRAKGAHVRKVDPVLREIQGPPGESPRDPLAFKPPRLMTTPAKDCSWSGPRLSLSSPLLSGMTRRKTGPATSPRGDQKRTPKI